MIKLTLTEKGGEPKVLTFDKDEITIGRVSGNDIVLAKGNISKRHTRLTKREGGMEIADLKSTNGTYVNGRKIAGPTAVAPSDRIYVGDFLIGLDGPGAALVEPGGLHSPASGLHSPASTTSASRRLSVPPPPPPPARGGSSASRLPDEETSVGGEDEEDSELAARPPRAGRPIPPPPPPPPPARRPTPMASASLGLDDEEVPFSDGPPLEMSQPSEDTGNVGLFQHTRRGGDDDADGASRRVGTGNRPGLAAAAAPQAPAFGGATGPVATLGPDASGAGAAPGLETLLADPAVTQILITAPDAALVDRGAGLSLYDGDLGDSNAVADVLWRYANNAYPPPPPDNPVVDVRLPDGTRVSAAFPPAAPGGVVASIRRTVLPDRVMVDLVPGANKDVQALLDAIVATRRNVLVTGDAAALPSVLAAFGRDVPADRRVVAIGAGTRSRSGWIDLAPAADATGLLRVAAALRPDHLVVGDLSGPEAGEIVLVAARGQNGLLLAMPGRSPSEAVSRFGALAAVGLGATATATPLVANAFDLYVHVVAAEGGARIIEIGELRANGAELTLDVALSMYGEGSKREAGNGRLQGRGVSARLGAALAAAGSPLPSGLIAK